MRIEIDGAPLDRPSYIGNLPNHQYLEYLINAQSQRQHGLIGIWQGLSVKPIRGNILNTLAHDPDLNTHMASVVRHGKDYKGIQLASHLADELAKSGDLLELVPQKGSKVFNSGFSKNDEQRYGGNLDYATPILGTFLQTGTMVFRGNVGEVSALRGGTLYIDGDVNRLYQCEEGIVYVNGDVNLIEKSDKAVLVVAGRVKKYVEYQRSRGGLNREVTPSPFIFTSHELEKVVPDARHRSDSKLPEQVAAPISPSYVVSQDRLANWKPEETKSQALALCRERIGVYLEDLKKLADGVSDPATMAKFARINMFGFTEGSVSGYYQGSHDATPAWMVD